MSVRRDERSWRLSGDPVRVDIGPPVFPGCTVDVVPVNELRRAEHQLTGAVSLSDEQWARVLWLLHTPTPPGPAKALDEKIIRAINSQRGR